MKTKFNAILLSALVFPGLGQYYYGSKKKGILFIVFTSVVLVILIVSIVSFIFEEIQTDIIQGRLDTTISSMINYSFRKAVEITPLIWSRIMVWTVSFVIIWLYAIIDVIVCCSPHPKSD